MALDVPLQAVASQVITVGLNGQSNQIRVYQRPSGLYLDLYDASQTPPALIVGGVLCENRNRIVRDAYLGFSGDLMFFDTQGDDDPDYTGLDGRFFLAYLSPADLATVGLAA